MAICEKRTLNVDQMIQQLRSNKRFDEVGGIAAFIGVVRSTSAEGEEVDHLELEAYEGKAENTLTTISDEIRARPGVVEVLIRHAVGKLDRGEMIMAIVVAGRTRKDVFPALADAVERTKREAPIWKKEVLSSGQSHWISTEHAPR